MLTDTHCHLNSEPLSADPGAFVARAAQAGVDRLIVVGYDLESSRQAAALAERYAPGVYAAVGIHPHEARTWDAVARAEVRRLAGSPRVVAVGEIGLDYFYDHSPRGAQAAAFADQLVLASSVGLPVIVHCRDAYADVLDTLERASTVTGVVHCWMGSPAEAVRAVGAGWALGFGGAVTFAGQPTVREALAAVPLSAVLLETDAPYMAPAPGRKWPNEPARLPVIAERVAAERGIKAPALIEAVEANAERVFGRIERRS